MRPGIRIATIWFVTVTACSSSSPADDPDASIVFPDAGAPDAADIDATPAGPCDPVAQTGCGETQKCSIAPSPTVGEPPMLACVPATGTKLVLDSCTPATATSADDCVPGLACRGDSDPRCLAFCADQPDTCSGADICLFSEDLDGDLNADVRYCARLCDVLGQDCDQSGVSCYPTRDGEICVPEGAGSAPVGEGQSCEFANSCAEGLGCFRVGSSPNWLCFKVCDANNAGGPGCAANQVCNRHESDDWGVCVSIF